MLTNPYLSAILQFLDGALTYLLVSGVGIDIEGNPLLRQSMNYFGVGETLFFAKLFCAVGCLIVFQVKYNKTLIGLNTVMILTVISNIFVLYTFIAP